ncbi:MAG: hypothetical protein WB952_21790 [Terriglobales bacterium]
MTKLSTEATIGLAFEIILAILDHLHVKEPIIIWGLFVVGLVLIGDSISRGEWAEKITNRKARIRRRIVWGAGTGIAFLVFGLWVRTRLLTIETPASPEQSTPRAEIPQTEGKPELQPHPAPREGQHVLPINPTFRTEFSSTTFEQFPEETMIGGLPFNHGEIAVHFYAFVDRSDVEDLNTHIWLVHRGGRATGISGIGPISTCPGIVVSQPTSSDVTPKSVTVIGGKSPVTVPLNSTSSVGNFSTSPSGSWLIHCDKVLKGMTPDFIIRVLRPISNKNQPDPLRWRLLDALVAQGTYKTKSGKEVPFRNISIYDDDGNPHSADKNEVEEILKRGSAGATTFYLPTRPPSQ